MRSTSLALAVFCIFFLSGCSAKSSPNLSDPSHAIQLSFNGAPACTTYFIDNDAIVYQFNTEGTHMITPGDYLFIYSCGSSHGMRAKMPYIKGKNTVITGNPGLVFEQN